jgi:ribulose-phosphate 3-epimerase
MAPELGRLTKMKHVFINGFSAAADNSTVICPAVMAHDKDQYRDHINRLAGVAKRVHIDVGDGTLMHARLLPAKDVWWPDDMQADIHLMTIDPLRYVDDLLKLEPQMVIVQAEANGNFLDFADKAHRKGVAVGVALKPETPVSLIQPALRAIDHVLIFSGYFSHISGHANTHLLTKVLHLKQLRPGLEIGWEGGVNSENAAILAASGVNVLNISGHIQRAANPRAAYEQLEAAVKALPSSHKRL